MKRWLALALLLAAVRVTAHEVRPAFLELTERAPGEFDVLWKVPALGGVPLAGEEVFHEQPKPTDDKRVTAPCGCQIPHAALGLGVLPIHPLLPADAKFLTPIRTERLQGSEVKRWTVQMPAQDFQGVTIGVHGLEATMVDVLVRVGFADGRVVSRLIRPDAPSFTITAESLGPAASGYLVLGVEHILLGIDHLLFVLCLLLLVRGWGAILKTVTAFTVAHSITLGLAALGYVNVPSAPVEATIALSIVFLATEIVKHRTEGNRGNGEISVSSVSSCSASLTVRQPWLIAFVFGLLHGFGFAGALSEVGLPANDVPLALLLFNVGVEAGQLLFVAAALPVVLALRGLVNGPVARLRTIPAYGIGALASWWLIARVATFW